MTARARPLHELLDDTQTRTWLSVVRYAAQHAGEVFQVVRADRAAATAHGDEVRVEELDTVLDVLTSTLQRAGE